VHTVLPNSFLVKHGCQHNHRLSLASAGRQLLSSSLAVQLFPSVSAGNVGAPGPGSSSLPPSSCRITPALTTVKYTVAKAAVPRIDTQRPSVYTAFSALASSRVGMGLRL
jgi:hypothetical protein